MKTKDFLLYLLVAVFMGVLTSCSGSELKEVSSEDWIEFPEGVSYTVEREGGQLEITFSASENWSLSVQEDWLDVTPVSGNSGENTILVTVTANDTEEVRNSTLHLVSNQSAASAEITINPLAELI